MLLCHTIFPQLQQCWNLPCLSSLVKYQLRFSGDCEVGGKSVISYVLLSIDLFFFDTTITTEGELSRNGEMLSLTGNTYLNVNSILTIYGT